jgi:putative transposase
MFSIIELTRILCGVMSVVEVRQFADIISAFFCVSHATTTRSLGRYTDCSERTIFRFLGGTYDWAGIRSRLFAAYSWDIFADYVLAIDETVEGKSRKKTFGSSRFYSSTAQQSINGVCFFGATLINVQTQVAHFLGTEQVVYSAEDKARIAAAKTKKEVQKTAVKPTEPNTRGRKPGTKNKPKEENPTASFRVFKVLITKVLTTIRKCCVGLNLHYLLADSAYGTKDYADFAQTMGLYLLSKFKSNVALYLPYSGQGKGKRPNIYGAKLDLSNLPITFLKEEITDDNYKIQFFQLSAYAKNTFGAQLLNIVVIRTVNLENQKVSTQVWFCTDLSIGYLTLLHYYHLRFQIEFDFRDAKQYFGLSDFKNYKERNMTNFVNLSFTMCLVAQIQQAHFRKTLNIPKLSILDLKTIFKARFNAKSILKLVQNDPNLIFNTQFCAEFIPNDLINSA